MALYIKHPGQCLASTLKLLFFVLMKTEDVVLSDVGKPQLWTFSSPLKYVLINTSPLLLLYSSGSFTDVPAGSAQGHGELSSVILRCRRAWPSSSATVQVTWKVWVFSFLLQTALYKTAVSLISSLVPRSTICC